MTAKDKALHKALKAWTDNVRERNNLWLKLIRHMERSKTA